MIDPRNQFLLSMGANLMGQPYSPTPQGTFGGLGNAMNQGMGAFQNAMVIQQAQMKAQADAQAKRKKLEEQQAAIIAYAQTLPPEQQTQFMAMARLDPGKALEMAMEMNAPKEPVITADDAGAETKSLLLEMFGRKSAYTQQEMAAANAEQQKRSIARQRAGAGRVDPMSQSINSALLESDLAQMTNLIEKTPQAYELREMASYARELSDAITAGGVGAETINKINSFGQNLGLPTIQSADQTAMNEGLMAVQRRMINTLRGIAPSDPQFTKADLFFYEQQTPGLSTTPGGRKLMLDMIDAQANRVLDAIDILEDIRTQDLSAPAAAAEFRSRMAKRESDLPKLMDDLRAFSPESTTTESNLPRVEAGNAKVYATIEEGEASGDEEFIVDGVKYRN